MFRPRNRPGAARRPGCVRAEPLEGRTLLSSVSGTVYYDADGNGAYGAAAGDYGLEGVIVYHDANNNGRYDSGAASVFAPAIGLPRAIRDFRTTTSTIVVEDLPGFVRDVDVMVNIEHTYTFDLMVTLESPGGDEIVLFDNVGVEDFFGYSMNFNGTILDDEAGLSIFEGEPPYPGRYRPQEPLSTFDGDPMNGEWILRITDFAGGDEGALIDWGLTFDTGNGEPAVGTDFEGKYELADLGAGTYRIRQVVFEGYRQTQPASNAAYVLALTEGQELNGRDFGQAFGAPVAAVVGRHLFYNHSAFDGLSAAANAADDGAIATDKRALRRGTTATFENYSSYARGINGVMVDVSDLPSGAAPAASDFQFKVGNDGDPANWPYLEVSPTVSLRRGAGVNGSDRITLTWPDGTIVGRWLEVTVNPTLNTGLSSSDVFYFGNLPGEVGDAAAAARVTATDAVGVRSAMGDVNRTVVDPFDFNRDRRINSLDYAIARANIGRSLFMMTVAASPGTVAVQGDLFGSVPIASRRGAYQPPRAWSETERNLLA